MTIDQLMKCNPGQRLLYQGSKTKWVADQDDIGGSVVKNTGEVVTIRWDDNMVNTSDKMAKKLLKSIKKVRQ